jgi:hypothetical protein
MDQAVGIHVEGQARCTLGAVRPFDRIGEHDCNYLSGRVGVRTTQVAPTM